MAKKSVLGFTCALTEGFWWFFQVPQEPRLRVWLSLWLHQCYQD